MPLGAWSHPRRPSAWGVAPLAVMAVLQAGLSTVGTGVSIADQIQTGRQTRELAAYQSAQNARAQALQLRAAEAAQVQQAQLAATRALLVARLVPVLLVSLVGLGLLLALRPRRKR